MNEVGDSMAKSTDAVEALLERAAPRPTPPDRIETEIRDAVRVEWMATRKRHVRRRFAVGFGMAATVMLALAISFTGLRQSGVVPVEVATIDRSVGTLYVQSGDSVQTTVASAASIVTGQIITTGRDSAAGLTWLEGGSLRIDGGTRIEFSAGNEVFLHSGRIYFDSAGSDRGSELSIRTTHGIVSHVGTQYMTESDAANLIVSVREGEVSIDGTYHDQAAYEGQRVQMTGSAQPSVTNTSGTGNEWQWIEAVSPNISVDGMSTHEFLQWVGRETGHGVEYETESAETLARNTQLKGKVVASPRDELRLRMMTVDLDAQFDPEGPAIIVTD
jgi:ferric-dicitrate binding protein FerR (iron transport regulator)